MARPSPRSLHLRGSTRNRRSISLAIFQFYPTFHSPLFIALAGRRAVARPHPGHQLQMTHIVYVRLRVQAKLCDRSQHSGRIVGFDFDRFRGGAAGDSDFGELGGVLFGNELPPQLDDVDRRKIAMRPDEVADELAVRVGRLRDVRYGDAKIAEYLLDDRARVERELALQHGTPSLEPPDLFEHQLEVDRTGPNFQAGGVSRARQDVGLRALVRLGGRHECGQAGSEMSKEISP